MIQMKISKKSIRRAGGKLYATIEVDEADVLFDDAPQLDADARTLTLHQKYDNYTSYVIENENDEDMCDSLRGDVRRLAFSFPVRSGSYTL